MLLGATTVILIEQFIAWQVNLFSFIFQDVHETLFILRLFTWCFLIINMCSLYLWIQVYFDYMRSWIQMLQQLPQASHSLKNLLEEEWNFTKVITPYIRGGEAQSGKLFWLVSMYTRFITLQFCNLCMLS